MGTVVALELEHVDRVWRSRVEEQQGARLVVAAPGTFGGDAVAPKRGQQVTVGWPSKLGYLEAEASVLSTDDGPDASWTVQVHTSELSQRRSAYRLEAKLEVTIAFEELGSLGATTRNVSEGGLAIELPDRYEVASGEQVRVSLRLPDGIVNGRARIVRSAPMVPDGLEVVVAFEDLDEGEAEQLRQFVFDEQLTRRSAGVA
ncbi:MAG TPA: PilZ domain-containing protein [Egicoccus sp.]|nr:PilZ domain-containing protein [Egicoccus sp.]HSK22736.1 PilZ domain-containing protein [Egicoccus sp.]